MLFATAWGSYSASPNPLLDLRGDFEAGKEEERGRKRGKGKR